jgi:hypothetical protein
MSTARDLRLMSGASTERLFEIDGPNTEVVTVLFTGLASTLRALAVARGLGRALGARVMVIAVKTARLAADGSQAASAQDDEAAALQLQLRAAGDVRFRVFAAPSADDALRVALAPASLVVVGGRRRWWPTATSRLCGALEALGHFVLFVDEAHHAA